MDSSGICRRHKTRVARCGRVVCILPLLWLCGAIQAAPRVVSLDTGERLVGEVSPASDAQTLVLHSALLGELRLPRTRILKIEDGVPAVGKPGEGKVAEGAATSTAAAEAATETQDGGVPDEAAAVGGDADDKRLVQRFLSMQGPESWKGNLRVGLNLSKGDNRWTETHLRGNLEIQEPRSPHFYRFEGSYTYRETEAESGDTFRSTDKYDATFTYRRSFAQNWFVQNALGWRVDQLGGIDRELQELLGVGYKYRPVEKLEVLVGGGGGIEDYRTDFEDTRTGLNPVMNVFQEFTWKPLDRTSLVQKLNYYWNPDNSAQFNYILSAALRIRLTEFLGVEFSFNQNFDNDVGDGNSYEDTRWRNALIFYF